MTETAQSGSEFLVRRRIADTETPVGALLKLGADTPGNFLFESIQGGDQLGRYSFIGHAPDLWWRVRNGKAETASDADFSDITATSDDPMADLDRFTREARIDSHEDLPPMAAGAFGYLGYDMIRYVEPVGTPNDDPLDMPEAILVRPRVVLIFDHLYQELTLAASVRWTAPETRFDALRAAETLLDEVALRLETPQPMVPTDGGEDALSFASNTSKERYFRMVEQAKAYTRAGDIFQVVPSQRYSAPFRRSSIAFYRALRRLNPSAFMFHMRLGALQLIGSSPEILVRVRDGRVAIRPIAGTRPRSGDPEEDARRKASLLADEKELSEHLMLLDLGRNDVGRVAAYGSVTVTEQFVVERYSHVMHIVSHVEGDLRAGKTLIDALMAGFPAGTVSGAPKIRAMQIIDELETHKRGVYGGAIGYFGWKGDLDTCIALRTAVLKDGQVHIQAGGGVVLDSDPQYEFDETVHKARALMKAANLAAMFEFDQ